MKIDITLVESVLTEKKVPQKQIEEILAVLEAAGEEEKADKKSGEKKAKNQFIIVCVSDDEATRKTVTESTLFLTTIKADDDHGTIIERARRAGYKYNSESRAGIKNPAKTLSAIFQNCKRKFFKAENIALKSNEPIIVVAAENKL